MFEPSQTSPGEWFDCLNVGDDHIEDKKARRKDKELTIPGFSLVEIVGIKKLNDDHYVHEVRLPIGELPVGQDQSDVPEDEQEKIVPIGINYAFTGPADIRKDRQGRMKFPPALCRFEGDEADTAKIFGRFEAPERVRGGKFTEAEYDEFEFQQKLFGQGVQQQLVGDPAGHLKLPGDIAKTSQFGINAQYLGWNCLGIYKYNTGEKTKGKKDDENTTKNLLAYVSPAVQKQRPTTIRFITHEPYSTYVLREYGNDSYDFDGDLRAGQTFARMVDGEIPVRASILYYDPKGNHKQVIFFTGDSVSGTIKLVLEGNETTDIILNPNTLNESYLTGKLEALNNIGKGNVKVSIWPGHWLIEFVGDLTGNEFDHFEVDIPEPTSVYKSYAYTTNWADTGIDTDVLFPLPLIGLWDSDDAVINDAAAGGTVGKADWMDGVGYLADVGQCRNFNGDGTPNL